LETEKQPPNHSRNSPCLLGILAENNPSAYPSGVTLGSSRRSPGACLPASPLLLISTTDLYSLLISTTDLYSLVIADLYSLLIADLYSLLIADLYSLLIAAAASPPGIGADWPTRSRGRRVGAVDRSSHTSCNASWYASIEVQHTGRHYA